MTISAFRKTRLWPPNHYIFTDKDFLSSSATNRPCPQQDIPGPSSSTDCSSPQQDIPEPSVSSEQDIQESSDLQINISSNTCSSQTIKLVHMNPRAILEKHQLHQKISVPIPKQSLGSCKLL